MPSDPMRDLRAWQEPLGRLSAPHPDSWTPPIDVYQTATRSVVAAEVPGLARDQIELAFEASRLTIRGRRVDHGTQAGDIVHFHQVERGQTLPKAVPPPPRRIEVR